jgi:hypothetical protein
VAQRVFSKGEFGLNKFTFTSGIACAVADEEGNRALSKESSLASRQIAHR